MKFKRLIWGSILIIALFLLCYNYSFNYSYLSNHGYCMESATAGNYLNYSKNQFFISSSINEIYSDYFGFYDMKFRTLSGMIIRSLFGMILFLLIFVRFWKFDVKKMIIIRRK